MKTLHSSQAAEVSPQSGFVSLFSVIFFALLATVITVGFIRIMNIEQQQSLNNDLTARALAASEAGVEDAKRAIARYASMPGGSAKTQFRQALTSNECDGLYRSGSPVGTAIGLNPNGVVASDQNLSYTCLTVDLDTADFIDTIGANQSQIIPLRSGDDFNQITLQWHLNSGEADVNGDGLPSNYQLVDGSLPTVGEFGDAGAQPPAYIRAQLIGAPNSGSISRNELEDRSRTVFLMPSEDGGNTLSFQTADNPGNSTNNYGFNTTKSSPFVVNCQSQSEASAAIGDYACRATLTLPGGSLSPDNNRYYLQVTALYRDTHVRATLAQNGEARNFRDAQPRIDSNGLAADTFRRVEVRTNFPGDNFSMPRYGAEVGENVCKNFHVTSTEDNWKPNECS